MRAAFIGLGVMGFPMAGHLQSAGHQVTVYNRSAAKADAWVERYGGCTAPTPAEAAQGADVVMTCVGNDHDVREVVLGVHGALLAMSAGSVLVDHTTASAALARELAAASAASGVGFLDAPVSGGQQGAEGGRLSIMVGGEEATYERIKPVLAAYGKAITRIGPVGSGQLTKMVNQICLAGLTQALAEALAFVEHAGLDGSIVLQAISQGAAQSWMMDHRAGTMLDDKFDFGFAVNWMRKDLSICLDTARSLGASLPVTAVVDQFFADLQRDGGGRRDITSLIRRLRGSDVATPAVD
ncbi:NAD(P)-dependent oxidoreductase [Defluviicoccus vanus]|uniref:NAD(P)-dependent oxidoreductase n=1 Tax=Defluviicoccus vanus TaxID=111831 RepID=A0A7H1MXC1_9PROT|nr:NAD(P)-dependent oxidoreductase [Defluviicoccus vanus]QNT68107.1 NAD(P)-dependent oxidoreductase [Defluviicoccus vanus]